MDALLLSLGRLAAVVGALITAFAGFRRATGIYFLGGFEVGTLLLAGTAAMVFACMCFLVVLTNRTPLNR